MAEPINEVLLSNYITHQHYLERYKTFQIKQLVNILKEAEAEMKAVISSMAGKMPSEVSVARKNALLRQVQDIQKQYNEKLESVLKSDMYDLSVQEMQFSATQIEDALSAIGIDVSTALITPEKLHATIDKTPIVFSDGRYYTVQSLIKTFTDKNIGTVTQTVRNGFVLNQSIDKIAKQLFGLQGSYVRTYNNAASVARTLVMHYAQTAKDLYFKNNRDVVKGYEWISTLDARTTVVCQSRDGLVWIYDVPELSTLPGEVRPPAHYNCYDKETEVYTDQGWKFFKDLNGSEKCFSFNPENPKENDFILPVQYIKEKHVGEMIHFINKNKSFDLMVTPDHNMLVKYRGKGAGNRFRFVKAKDMPKWDNIIYRGLEWDGNDVSEVQLGNYVLPAELYCKFMGYYLSEGSTTKTSKNSYHIKISQEKYLDKFYEDLQEFPIKVHRNKESVSVYNQSIGDELIKYGHSHQKYVPENIKKMSPRLIEIFLNAYVLGDRSTYVSNNFKNGNFLDFKTIHTSSKKMADDIGELIMKVGGRPSFNLRKYKGIAQKFKNGTYIINHDVWTICWAHSAYVDVEKMAYNRIDYNDYVYCVTLPKWHTLYVRRNGKTAWSGNCRSVTTPVLRSWQELGIEGIKEFSPGTRASLTGQVPEKLTYTEWFNNLDKYSTRAASIRKDILGPVRYDLWKRNELQLQSFYGNDGRWLSLKELAKKDLEISKQYVRYF